jgi:cyclophilin family peptidyl-prolyl cis-trans isomerase
VAPRFFAVILSHLENKFYFEKGDLMLKSKTGILLALLTLGAYAVFASESYLEPEPPSSKSQVQKNKLKPNKGHKLSLGEALEKDHEALKKRSRQYHAQANQVQGQKKQLMLMQSRGSGPQVQEFMRAYFQGVQALQKERSIIIKDLSSYLGRIKRYVKGEKAERRHRIIYADVLGQLEMRSEKILQLQAAAKEAPLNPPEALDLATTYSQMNRFEEAVGVLNVALKGKVSDAQRANLSLSLAEKLFYLQEFKESIGLLKVLEADPATRVQASRQLLSIEKIWELHKQELIYQKADKNLPQIEIQTNRGALVLELFEDDAPNAVANFIQLTEKKYYDGQAFHRVLPAFMAQGGDPNSKDNDPKNDGQGGPGYKIKTEISRRKHFRGVLSYANAGLNTDGSQFFLTVVPTYWLNGKHAVFGRILKGMKIADSLEKGDRIEKIRVLRKRDHEYSVKKL